ncbi:transcriptional regulator (plasmid) [Arthrobacter sp. MN05-02]|nr:transcriptional regulator [Arthrobacter sp. MN05-02]
MSGHGPVTDLGMIIGRTKGLLLSKETAQDAVDGLAGVARNVIDGADGAGVSLLENGQRTSVGATDGLVREADDLQYTLNEGPCLDAGTTGQPILIADTTTDPRWTHWCHAVAEAGVGSCLSVPLMRSGRALGAMKVYARAKDAFNVEDQQVLSNLANAAAALLGHVQSSDTPQRIASEIQAVLQTRSVVDLARGILMERHSLTREEALAHLMARAAEDREPMDSIALAIVDGQDGISLSEAK